MVLELAREVSPADVTAGPAAVPHFSAVFKEYAPYVWRSLRRLGVKVEDVEDACQDVFVVVHRKLGAFEGRSSIKTWVFGICLKTASEYRRKKRGERETPTEKPPEQQALRGPHEDFEQREAVEVLDRLLEVLDDDKREVFVLYEIEQLTMREIAEIVSCPLQTAYARLYAARKLVEAAAAKMERRQGP
jgi:RNA polymerase sigma-70 factor (ECF subfamily)